MSTQTIQGSSALTPKQRRAITSLLQGATQLEAAAAVGVNRSTIARWMDSAEFLAELRAGQDAMMQEAVRRVVVGVGDALDTLSVTMSDPTATAAARVAAARAMLDTATRWVPVAATADDLDIDVTILSDAELDAMRLRLLKVRPSRL